MKTKASVSAAMLILVLLLPGIAGAVVINKGLDYFCTVDAIHPLPAPIGPTPFKKRTINYAFDTNNFGVITTLSSVCGADTVVERLDDTVDLNVGDTDTVAIEMVALSLQSVDPVNIGGSFFDAFVVLDLGPDLLPDTGDETASTGQMDITLDMMDTATGRLEGRYSSIMDIYADIFFVPVGVDPVTLSDIVASSVQHQDVVILDLAANDCAWFGPGFYPSYDPLSPCAHASPNGDVHIIDGDPVSEPTTLAIAFTGFMLMRLRRRRIR